MSALYPHVHKLWLFSLLAEHRSFKRAAAHAGLTQSALSQHLSNLETTLGRTLIVRSRTTLALTEEGERLHRHVVPILKQLDALNPSARADVDRTPLRLGVYESVALTYLPRPLHRLTAKYRDIDVRLRMGRAATLQLLVREGELDMAILDSPATLPMESTPIASSRLGLYHSARHPPDDWSSEGVIKIGSLAYGRGAHPDYFLQFLDFHERHFRAQGLEMRVSVLSDSFEVLSATAQLGALLAVLPTHVADRSRGELVELPLPNRPPECAGHHTFHLVSRRQANGSLREALCTELAATAA